MRTLEQAEAELAQLREALRLDDAAREYVAFLFATGVYNADIEWNKKARDEWLAHLAAIPTVKANRRIDAQGAAIEKLRKALAAILGADLSDPQALKQLEFGMPLVPAPAADKAAAIDGLHALRDTAPQVMALYIAD